MKYVRYQNIFKKISIFTVALMLNSCKNLILLHPKGEIGLEQRSLIYIAFVIMLTIVIPTIMMTIIFAAKYRASNKKTKYNPNWTHSNKIEIIIWTIPVIIIIFLGYITWKSTYSLDPRKPILSNNTTLLIEVISLDWKWLFIYPQYNIATINEIVFPVNTPIKFKITSNSVMNSFFIPQLGGQIYAMAGMKSIIHLIANKPGNYKGISSNFSGKGFSGMKFTVIVSENELQFNNWISKVQSTNNQINTIYDYEKIAQASINHPVTYFSKIPANIFQDIINKFKI